jgi:hypothetical protein
VRTHEHLFVLFTISASFLRFLAGILQSFNRKKTAISHFLLIKYSKTQKTTHKTLGEANEYHIFPFFCKKPTKSAKK